MLFLVAKCFAVFSGSCFEIEVFAQLPLIQENFLWRHGQLNLYIMERLLFLKVI